MSFEVMPFQSLDMQFLRGEAAEDSSNFIADSQSGEDRQRGVDPGAGDAGQFVQAEQEGCRYGQWGMQAKERGEADKDADGKARSNMPGMTVQSEDLTDSLPPFFLVEHVYPHN